MLTGTPLDLTPFGALLSAVGGLYWLVAAGALWWAWKRAPTRQSAWKRVIGTALLFGVIPLLSSLDVLPSRSKKVKALFAERCKSSGETIKRTVDNVDGVVWMKWREPFSNVGNFADQFKLNDPFGRDCGGESCIADLLRVTQGAELNPEEAERHAKGYRFVETRDPSDGRLYRYTARLGHNWSAKGVDDHKRETGQDLPKYVYRMQVVREPIQAFSTTFGIEWEDISTQEDRELWIAGGKLRIVDLTTGESIAERVGYVVDAGQGSEDGGRSPWLFARRTACPVLVDHEGKRTQIGFTLRFASKVLRHRDRE